MFDIPIVIAPDVNAKLLREMVGSFFGELFEQRLQFGIGRGQRNSRLQFHQRTVSDARVISDL